MMKKSREIQLQHPRLLSRYVPHAKSESLYRRSEADFSAPHPSLEPHPPHFLRTLPLLGTVVSLLEVPSFFVLRI